MTALMQNQVYRFLDCEIGIRSNSSEVLKHVRSIYSRFYHGSGEPLIEKDGRDNKQERIIVNIIQEQDESDVDQRKLVRKSGFSKAKVSRILLSLEERGVISRVRIGRKKKVILEKKFREE